MEFDRHRVSPKSSDEMPGQGQIPLVYAAWRCSGLTKDGAIHFQWGIGGMLMTCIMGAAWGTAHLLCGHNLWILILAHSSGHLLFVTQLYFASSLFF